METSKARAEGTLELFYDLRTGILFLTFFHLYSTQRLPDVYAILTIHFICLLQADLRLASFRVLLECLYVLAHFFAPLLPAASTEILRRLGTPSRSIASLNCEFNNLTAGTPVGVKHRRYQDVAYAVTVRAVPFVCCCF